MTNEVEGERNQHNNDEKEEEEQQQQKMPPMKQRLTQSQMEFFLDYNPITLKAVEYKICSCARPHMRGFHLAWTSFLVAFIAWFSIAPLAPAIKETLGLKKSDLLWANISSVLSTVFARFAVGPVMDHVGPRKSQAFILMFAAIPTCFAGLIQDVVGLCIIRGLIGVAGAAFVGCQFWCTLMFEKEIAGTVNATAGGWGNLGGGLTQALMVGIFSMNTASPGCDQECGWRNAFFIPAFALMLASVLILFLGDDCPQGHYIPPVVQETTTTTTTTTTQHAIQSNTDQKKMKRRKAHIADVAGNPQVWALVLQYACCFGMELHVNNTIALYYYDRFGLGITTAGLVASLFGLTNIFARAWGGMISDLCYKHWGMNGRKYSLVCLACSEGVLLIVFSRMPTLPSSITMMVIFSVVVQATEGSTFGIVPYVDPLNSGGVCGFVGAGGNIGAVVWGLVFLSTPNFSDGYMILGFVVLCVGLLGIPTIRTTHYDTMSHKRSKHNQSSALQLGSLDSKNDNSVTKQEML
mmetsp:Transcript_16625/g.27019  ORF Transcript_16625/g.27019 Transcript_16625/m.27019 type:complete len:522 (+) Transcript_16625:97-1662(+)